VNQIVDLWNMTSHKGETFSKETGQQQKIVLQREITAPNHVWQVHNTKISGDI
jgi:hypothetical protein